jgi:hypothetical protein
MATTFYFPYFPSLPVVCYRGHPFTLVQVGPCLAGSSGLSPTWLVIVAYTTHGEPSIPAGLTGFGEARAKV